MKKNTPKFKISLMIIKATRNLVSFDLKIFSEIINLMH